MHHAHRTTVVVLYGLVIVSLLTAGLGGWIPAKAAALSAQESAESTGTSASAENASAPVTPLASSTKPVTQDPSPYPAPGSEEVPPPEPLPEPLPQETAQDEAENAAAMLSTYPADSPLLARNKDEAAPPLVLAALQAPVPSAALTLLYQAQIPEAPPTFCWS